MSSFLSLKVNDHGEALVTYRTAKGVLRHVYVWGAINANAPDPNDPQVHFTYDYSGGLKRSGRQTWRTFADRCRPYDGPRLGVARERLQGARRLLLGAATLAAHAADARHRAVPARAGALRAPRLPLVGARCPCSRCSPNWTYGGRWQGLFGRLTYLGQPAFGFRTPSASRRDLLRALLLRRHVQLGVRPRLAARRRQGRAQPQRSVLLQLRAADDAGRLSGARAAPARERPAPPRHRDGARA